VDIARIDEVARQSVETLELSAAARHAFAVAQQFNYFYHRHHVLSEEDQVRRDVYTALIDLTRLGLMRLLDILGIEVPERM
jgi:arginyl-tRNA synthetase